MASLFSVQGYKKHVFFFFSWHGKLSYDRGTHEEQETKETSKCSVIKHKFYEKHQNEHLVSDLDSGEQCTAIDSR